MYTVHAGSMHRKEYSRYATPVYRCKHKSSQQFLIRGIKRSQKSPRALVIVHDRVDPSYCLRSVSSLHAA
jgi:hypothetical protein